MKEQKKKILWAILRFMVGFGLFLASVYAFIMLPDAVWGIEWLPGWPKFLSLILGSMVSMSCIFFISVWPSISQLPQLAKKHKQRIFAVACLCIALIPVAMHTWTVFKDTTHSEFIYSPSGKNVAVVITYDDNENTVWAAKKPLFYVRDYDNYAYLAYNYGDENTTHKWIDDNTLELVTTLENGSTETEYIRW